MITLWEQKEKDGDLSGPGFTKLGLGFFESWDWNSVLILQCACKVDNKAGIFHIPSCSNHACIHFAVK